MKLFVWDFHGVLERDYERGICAHINDVLAQFGTKRRLTLEETYHCYGYKLYQYFEFLLPDESHQTHLQLQQAFLDTQDWSEIKKYIRPNHHAYRVLDAIHAKHTQILISNTQPHALANFLDAVDQRQYFPTDRTYAVSARDHDHQKITKPEALRNFLAQSPHDELVIIGDSPSDMALKKVAGGTTYFYVHPHLTHKVCAADHRITDLREILKEV